MESDVWIRPRTLDIILRHILEAEVKLYILKGIGLLSLIFPSMNTTAKIEQRCFLTEVTVTIFSHHSKFQTND